MIAITQPIDTVSPKTAETGTVLLTGGSVANIFTVSGGPVLVEALFAEIMATVSNNACDAKLVMDPAVGADTDMCVALDIAQDVIGSFLTIDGTIGNAMVNAVPGTALPLGVGMDIPLILPVGTVDLNLANSNPTTGSAIWKMRYRPIVDGSIVTAIA